MICEKFIDFYVGSVQTMKELIFMNNYSYYCLNGYTKYRKIRNRTVSGWTHI